jgi:prepilin-type N-terminal cleavage/methylation domain-containing protein
MQSRNEGFTLIELMIVVVIIGILAAIAIPNFQNMRERALEANTKRGCHVVQLAAEDYAVRNNGLYSDAGADLQPMLPGGNLLVNAFTKLATEPQFGVAGALTGEIGIVAVNQAGVNVGYVINGIGRPGQILIVLSGQ